MMMTVGTLSPARLVPAQTHLKSTQVPAYAASGATSSVPAAALKRVNKNETRAVVARATPDGFPFGDAQNEDESAKTLKFLNTAMYRWCALYCTAALRISH